MVLLQSTDSPINREERNKINENWERITEAFRKMQAQISFLSGDADVEAILDRIESAIERSETTIEEMNDIMESLDSKLAELNTAISNSTTLNNQSSQLIIELNAMKSIIDTIVETIDNAEQSRIENEQTRTNQESQRVISESGRVDAETIRENNEAQRKSNEQTREQSEQVRVSEEAIRVAAENVRVANEQTRVAAHEDLLTLLDNMRPFEYNRQETYVYPNLVTNDGNTYMALQEVTGVTPSDDKVNYILIARKGTDGIGSVASVNGVGPDENGNVEIQLGSGDVKTVNGVEPDEDGNVEIEVGEGAVKTVNSIEPDEGGNVEIDVGVKSVNNVSPSENGNVNVNVGVKSVNNVQPDNAGNANIDVGVKVINSKTPNANGEVTIGLEDYDVILEELEKIAALIKVESFTSTEGQTVFNLTEGEYVIGENRVRVTVGGVPQYSPENYEETSTTSITLNEGITAGLEVVVEYFEVAPIITDITNVVNGHISITNPQAHTIDNILGLRDALDALQSQDSDIILANISNLTTDHNYVEWTNPSSNDFIGVEVYLSTSDLSSWDRDYCSTNATLIDQGNINSTSFEYDGNVIYYIKVFAKYDVFGVTSFSRGVATSKNMDTIYLYNNGDQRTLITGGWNDSYSWEEHTKSPAVFESNKIKLSLSTTSMQYSNAGVLNKIDMTQLQRLYFKVNIIKSIQWGGIRFNNSKELGAFISNHVFSHYNGGIVPTIGESIIEVDVSSMTGETYFAICIEQGTNTSDAAWGGGSMEILEVWGEY